MNEFGRSVAKFPELQPSRRDEKERIDVRQLVPGFYVQPLQTL
jgi:hypothetical protein